MSADIIKFFYSSASKRRGGCSTIGFYNGSGINMK
jgi:hypothetical protein